jgi:nuclear transport factor 2 (NTF2) superfamily protein
VSGSHPPLSLNTCRKRGNEGARRRRGMEPLRPSACRSGLCGQQPLAEWQRVVPGHSAIVALLLRKRVHEQQCRWLKEPWTFAEDRIAIRFAWDWHDGTGRWFRSRGDGNWQVGEVGPIRARCALLNDPVIKEAGRRFPGCRSQARRAMTQAWPNRASGSKQEVPPDR